MDTIADYTAWKNKQQNNGVAAANVVLSTTDVKPDEAASDLNLANEFGKVTGNPVPPQPLVKEYRNVFQQRIEEEKNKTILSTSPRLTEWLRTPENAAVAKDDLSNLSWWELPFASTGNALSRGVKRIPQSYNQFMAENANQRLQDQSRSIGDIYSDVNTIRNAKGEKITESIIPGPDDVFALGSRYFMSRISSMLGWDERKTSQEYLQQAGLISKAVAETPLSPAGSRFRDAFLGGEAQGTAMDQVRDFVDKFAADPGGALAFFGETAVESIPSIAAATGVTMVTRNPALGAVAMGAQSGLQERYLEPAEFFKEKGIDISTPKGARQALSSPELMQEAAQRGVIRGTIIGALDGISGGIAGKQLAASPVGNMVLQSITQAIAGGAGEAGAQYATDGKIDMREVIVEALAEFVTAPIEVAGVGGRKFLDMRRKAKDAEARVGLFQELSGQAQSSALRNRLPEKFRQFVEAATANGPVENIYVPAGEFSTYFQSIGVDPFSIIEELEGVTREDLEVALAGGGDLQIPTATYAAKIAGSEHDAFLMENMRFDPDQFTAREAAEFNERAQDILQEAWDIAEATRVEQELNGSYEQEIYDTMVSRLRVAGRSTDVATTEATLYPAFYRVMAERSGMTMDDFMRAYPLPDIKGSLPEGMQFKTTDELNRTLAEARNRRSAGLEKRGPTLLEWISDYGGINDPGGELRARDAEVIRRGKGKKSLKLARSGVVSGMRDMFSGSSGRKYGVDDVALAAIEAGYLADNPIANEYRAAMNEGRQVPDIGRALFEAIDEELRGNPVYASDVSAQADDNAALDSIEEYLNSLGVSLENTDDEIRTAIEGARQYAQTEPPLLFQKNESGVRKEKLVWSDDGESATLKLTKKEQEYFAEIYSNAAETQEFKERVPSLRINGDEMFIRQEDMSALAQWFWDERDGYGALGIPPRLRQYFQKNESGARGSIQFTPDGQSIIRLFETANLSTMLHESGHYFLTVMQDLAVKGEQSATTDFETVKGWWRENAAAVAADARRSMPDVKVTAEDVIRALDNGTTGDVMLDGAIDVGMQEQFARGFEAYLMEGKAPSAELRSAFEKFRAWLVSIYRRLAGLNVNVSDDIRGVMDRMLATDQEIAKAKAESGETAPVFATGEQMGLTPEEYAAFLKLRSQAEDEAKAQLLREVMAPVKREAEKAYKAEKAKVREEVAREVNAFGFYRAMEWMGNRRWIGDDQPVDMPDMRMSKSILVERYGAGVLDTLPRGKQTVYAVEGGIDPDDAAGWFGFDSGDQMIKAMERAPKRTEAIDAETERVMRERHGDPLNDGSIEADALDAVHTDKRGQWIAAELKAITEIAGTGNMLTAKEARASARDTIAKMRVRDAMNANRFLAAERKAGEEAARLGAMLARDKVWLDAAKRRIATTARAAIRGDGTVDAAAQAVDDFNAKFETTSTTYTVPEQQRVSSAGNAYTIPGGERTTTSLGYNDLVAKMLDAKRRQLVNHALYTEARKIADEVEKAERYVAKLGKASTRERIAGAGRRDNAQVDYLSAIDELLDQYDFRKLSGSAEQRRGALNAFIQAMTAAGRENELAIPEKVLADAKRKPYKTLPVDELRGVVDGLKNLEHIAMRWDKLIDAQNERALDEAVAEVQAAFEENVDKRPPGRVGSRGEALRNTTRQFLDIVLNATTLLREIDGFQDMGAAYRNIKAPIDAAMTRLITRKQKAAADLEALYEVYSKDERRRMSVREFLPELGYSLSKWERIAVALNTGNAGNLQRLTDSKVRGSLTEEQVSAVLATLDERDANFVQSVWDYVGSFKGDIAARERRTTGVEPDWVEAAPVTIAGKTLKGGYYPIKYDPRLSSLARDDQTQEISQSIQAGRFGKAQTRNGHLKERAQSSGRDVELDMSVLHRHINQVIYDIELSEPVANSWRILQDGRIRSAFMESGKQADFDALEIWLKDVAEGELRSADIVGRAARTLKSNFTAAKLAFNLSTVLMQISGFAQTMVVVGKRDFALGVQASMRPGISEEITAKSSFMSTRQTTFNKDIYDFYSDPQMGPVASRWGDIKKEWIGPLSFWMMTKVQWYLVDIPTWMAGYKQGLRKFGNDEAKAVAHADDILKRSQASGLFSDRSAVERGSVSRTARQNDVVRLFTALGSYMFAKFNVAYERSATASRTIRQEGVSLKSAQEALSWTLDMAFLFTLEAVLTAAIKGQLPDEEDDDDDGWMKFLAKQTGLSVMATIPGIRDVAAPLQGFDGGGSYGAITKEVAQPFLQAAKAVKDEEISRAFVKSIINGTGLAFGLPSTQINRAVDASWRASEGEDVSPIEYIMGRSKK